MGKRGERERGEGRGRDGGESTVNPYVPISLYFKHWELISM